VVLKEGTALVLTTQEKLVSGEVPEGSRVLYRVERDVVDAQGRILIAEGTTARGKVVKSEGSGFFGRAGALNISVDDVDAVDGSFVALRSLRDSTGDDQEDSVIIGGVLLSVFFVFMEGDDVTLEKGTLITAFVDRNTNIAKPAPSRLTTAQLKSPRSLTLTQPVSGATIQKEDKLVFSASLTPEDPESFVRLYWNRKLVCTQRGNPGRIELDTRPYEKLTQEGSHTVEAEVTGAQGLITRSEPVTFTLKD